MLSRIVNRLKRPLDSRYDGRHPSTGVTALLRVLAPALRYATPNDKWSLGVHARQWLEALDIPPTAPLPPSQRLFMFAAYRGQFTLELALAVLLAWRGHSILFGYLPKLGSPVKPPLKDHPSATPYLTSSLAQIAKLSGGRIVPVDLTAYAGTAVELDETQIENRAVADAVMCLGREQIDRNDPGVAWYIAHYRELGQQAQRMLHGFFRENRGKIDLCLVPNGATFDAAHLALVARRFGLPINAYEKFTFRGMRLLSHGRPHVEYVDLDLVWSRRTELGLEDPVFRERAANESKRLLAARRYGHGNIWSVQYQKEHEQASADALREIGLQPGQPFALVCPNVPFDAGYYEFTRVFPSMRAWLVATVRRLLEVGTMPVVVRAHPAEVIHRWTKETAESILGEAGLLGREGLILIPGSASTNTYNLVEACHFGAVFTSTVGFEMTMMGKPVVLSSDIYYGRRGFTFDSDTIEHYLARVTEFAQAKELPQLSAKQVEDAQVFFYLLHYAVQWPFPYDKMTDVLRRPPAELIRNGAIVPYLTTLDAIATSPADFTADLSRFMALRMAAAPAGAGKSRRCAAVAVEVEPA